MVERFGAPRRVQSATIIGVIADEQKGVRGFAWTDGECHMEVRVDDRGLVSQATTTGTCPESNLLDSGWYESPRTDGLRAEYARFFETYRVWTESVQIIGSNALTTVELVFLAGFPKSNASAYQTIAVVRPVGQRAATPRQDRPTDIPASVFQTGEGRFLLDGETVIAVEAIQEIPLNLAADDGDYLVLRTPLRLLRAIGRAETVEIRLPSGLELQLPSDYLRFIGNLGSVIAWPEAVVGLAERSEGAS